MTNSEWIALFKRFPESRVDELVIVLHNGVELNIEQLVRLERDYIVIRGRISGSDAEGRAFFVPYDQMTYLRLEDLVTMAEVEELYGGSPGVRLRKDPKSTKETEPVDETTSGISATAGRSASSPSDMVRDRLMERIRKSQSDSPPPPPSK